MALEAAERRRLLGLSRRVRERIVRVVHASGSGHLGGSLSEVDLLVGLYGRTLRVNPREPSWPGRDRFVLSKGHGGLGLVAVLAEQGFLPEADLATFGATGSALGMHMDHAKVAGLEASTGSLGHGLGMAVGMALGARVQGLASRTYCLISDGECYEGSTWEAAISAAAFGLGRLTVLVDRNGLTMDGLTEEQVPLEPLASKWASFGFRAVSIDGHDPDEIGEALDAAAEERDRPTAIIARTVKGKGVDFMENRPEWHYGGLDRAMFERAMASIGRMYGPLEG